MFKCIRLAAVAALLVTGVACGVGNIVVKQSDVQLVQTLLAHSQTQMVSNRALTFDGFAQLIQNVRCNELDSDLLIHRRFNLILRLVDEACNVESNTSSQEWQQIQNEMLYLITDLFDKWENNEGVVATLGDFFKEIKEKRVRWQALLLDENTIDQCAQFKLQRWSKTFGWMCTSDTYEKHSYYGHNLIYHFFSKRIEQNSPIALSNRDVKLIASVYHGKADKMFKSDFDLVYKLIALHATKEQMNLFIQEEPAVWLRFVMNALNKPNIIKQAVPVYRNQFVNTMQHYAPTVQDAEQVLKLMEFADTHQVSERLLGQRNHFNNDVWQQAVQQYKAAHENSTTYDAPLDSSDDSSGGSSGGQLGDNEQGISATTVIVTGAVVAGVTATIVYLWNKLRGSKKKTSANAHKKARKNVQKNNTITRQVAVT